MSDSVTPWTVQNTGVGSLSLLQGIFPTQGLNPGLPYCRQILYQLSYQWIVKERFSELKYKSESDLKKTLRVMDV